MKTQEMIKRLFLSIAISVAALLAGTSSVTAAVTRCDGTLEAGTYDTLLVPKGKQCRVAGIVTVEQNVILQGGASLTAFFLTVNGNLQGDGVSSVFIQGPDVTIHGNVSITGATGQVVLAQVIIGGNLKISNSTVSQLDVLISQVTGNALFQNNTTASGLVIAGNMIVGNLVCNGNDPAPENGGVQNTVGGKKIGQCSAL
jgi:hypothetical protein